MSDVNRYIESVNEEEKRSHPFGVTNVLLNGLNGRRSKTTLDTGRSLTWIFFCCLVLIICGVIIYLAGTIYVLDITWLSAFSSRNISEAPTTCYKVYLKNAINFWSLLHNPTPLRIAYTYCNDYCKKRCINVKWMSMLV